MAAAAPFGAQLRVGRLNRPLRILAPLALALLMAGCGAPREDQGSRRARAPHVLTPAERDSVMLAQEASAGAHRDSVLAAQTRGVLGDWEEAWSRVIPGFKLDSLRWQHRDTLEVPPDYRIPLGATALDSLTQRRWKLLFTPDRWMAVDPEFTRVFQPNGSLDGYEADPAINVYDFRARRKLILGYGEVQNPFDVVGWIGERRLVVGGWARWPESNRFRPVVWIYDLDSLHRTTGMGPPVSEPELQAHEAMLELLIRMRNAPPRRR